MTFNKQQYKEWQRTKRGLLKRTYAAIKCRCSGRQITSPKYSGLPFVSAKAFEEWSLVSQDFNALFAAWEASQYARHLTPSIDRIDPVQGYLPGNMRWVTWESNRSRTYFRKTA